MGRILIKTDQQKKIDTRLTMRRQVLSPGTEKACRALLSIESGEYILNEFKCVGCLCQSNYPSDILIRYINLYKMSDTTTQSPECLVDKNNVGDLPKFNLLWVQFNLLWISNF